MNAKLPPRLERALTSYYRLHELIQISAALDIDISDQPAETVIVDRIIEAIGAMRSAIAALEPKAGAR
ncbi:hypothetical protein BH09MYX1_BH09MYX1_00870 [soil metagenome]